VLLPQLYELAKATPEVVAVIGNPPRIYKHGDAPQSPVPPYAVWYVLNDDPSVNLSSAPGSDRLSIHMDLYHTTDKGIGELAEAVRDMIETVGTITGMPIDTREPDTRLYRMAWQFDYWLMR